MFFSSSFYCFQSFESSFLPRVETRGIIEANNLETVTKTTKCELVEENQFQPSSFYKCCEFWAECHLQKCTDKCNVFF